MSKYHSNVTYVDNIRFASKKEADRYNDLKLMLRAGEITDLHLQPSFILQEDFDKNERHYKAITYKADFQYKQNGKWVIEDVKGFKTKEYLIKKKLFEKVFPEYTIREI